MGCAIKKKGVGDSKTTCQITWTRNGSLQRDYLASFGDDVSFSTCGVGLNLSKDAT